MEYGKDVSRETSSIPAQRPAQGVAGKWPKIAGFCVFPYNFQAVSGLFHVKHSNKSISDRRNLGAENRGKPAETLLDLPLTP